MLKLLPILLASFLGIAAASITCPKPLSYLPDPLDCGAFYQCSNWIPYRFECPAGLHFNLATTRCDYPANVGCVPSTLVPPEPTTVGPSTTTCKPRDGDNPEVDPENPEIIVEPGKDGECSLPPITIPVLPGRKKNISVTFRLESHPLDVYYLMDFSGSMRDDKANLVKLSSDLVAALKNMTKDFHLGFGSFVDKPIGYLGGKGDYSVKNIMPLTSATDDFAKRVDATPIKYGYDTVESASDALAQVALCDNQIGWRSNTRRMVVVASDALFHIAGDGMDQGVPFPFDGACHLDAEGNYPDELLYDYPSIDQLAEIVNQKGVTTIFAVTSDRITFYQFVVDKFKSGAVGQLSSDSSNIIQLIRDVYHKIESKVELEEADTTEDITIKYFSSCGIYSTPQETKICEEIGGSGEVTFILEVDLNICPLDPKEWSQTVRLQPVGLPTFIEVTLELLCG